MSMAVSHSSNHGIGIWATFYGEVAPLAVLIVMSDSIMDFAHASLNGPSFPMKSYDAP